MPSELQGAVKRRELEAYKADVHIWTTDGPVDRRIFPVRQQHHSVLLGGCFVIQRVPRGDK
eukprot:10930997-Lingulodinium_polyedra.AAC.1